MFLVIMFLNMGLLGFGGYNDGNLELRECFWEGIFEI